MVLIVHHSHVTRHNRALCAAQVPEGAHHLDLMFSNPADPPAVRAVRDVEIATMRRWIGAGGGGRGRA